MGYPMTYQRLLKRNRLEGEYDGTPEGLLRGDLRRLEQDQQDERHLAIYAARAGCTVEQARELLAALFGGIR